MKVGLSCSLTISYICIMHSDYTLSTLSYLLPIIIKRSSRCQSLLQTDDLWFVFCDRFRLVGLSVWSLDWNYSLEPDGVTSVYTTKGILLCLDLPGANSCAMRVRVFRVPPIDSWQLMGHSFADPVQAPTAAGDSWLLWLCLAQNILLSSHFHCFLGLTFFPFLHFCSVLWALLGMV